MTVFTPDQLNKYEAILWLTDPLGYRGSGRTELLAMAYINHALKYDMWIEIKNHDRNAYSSHELKQRIINICNERKELNLSIKGQGNTISIKIKSSEKKPWKNNPYLSKGMKDCPECGGRGGVAEGPPCSYCEGKGFVTEPNGGLDPCPSCKGTCLEYNPPPGRGRKCGNCRGKGYLDNEIDTCMACEGTGYLKLMEK